jgi:hypothetical protein
MYKTTPVLIPKNRLSGLDNDTAGSVYCFDTIENARN